MRWSRVQLLAVAALMLAAVLGLAAALPVPARAESLDAPPNTLPAHESVSDYWRALRQGEALRPSQGFAHPQPAIRSDGETWRRLRLQLRTIGGIAILVAFAGVILFALLRRPVPLEGGRTHRLVPRFTLLQRLAHWYVAFTFILLAVTGAVLLFGRIVLLPLTGPAAFAAIASAAKEGHNLFGPVFIIGLLMLIALYVRENIPSWVDVKWLLKGGLFFVSHLPAGKFNGGEKLWFWGVTILGLVLAVSGIVLDFPFLVSDRPWGFTAWQLSHLLHAAAAVLLIAGAIGHIYLGTIGTEGTLDGMVTGCVDERWARQHHDLWFEELKRKGETEEGAAHTPAACPQTVERLLPGLQAGGGGSRKS